MPASPLLADSSFYIQYLRQGRDPLRALAMAAAERDLAVCGIVRCEVGRALRPIKVRQKFRQFWDVMLNIPTDNRLWEETEQMLWDLDRAGTMVPLTDAIIACCAQRIGAVVLTYDRHFSLIPSVRVTDNLGL